MKIDDLRRSDNVEDRRGMSPGRTGASIGLGGLAILVVGYFFGISPSTLLGLMNATQGTDTTQSAAPAGPLANDPQTDFARAVLGETEDVWTQYFQELGAKTPYPPPTMVLFRDSTDSACGLASAASGPFYCPGDQKLYLDLAFFDELQNRFGAPGDFARAYVIAHEVGHHIQYLLGTTAAVQKVRESSSEAIANLASVKLELQADCYAGIWAQRADRAKKFLEQGDIDAALNAAAAVGDDTLQKKFQGRVVPETFTHGTSAQRSRWFKTGYMSGKLQDCDTFSAGANL
ncbi:MAG TPA: neutral zinc metallopeptidase [Steroidobacteraceae bacterium]|nr:neutral zinc metallopeptidase [Steroidobacteraceae bacterium]